MIPERGTDAVIAGGPPVHQVKMAWDLRPPREAGPTFFFSPANQLFVVAAIVLLVAAWRRRLAPRWGPALAGLAAAAWASSVLAYVAGRGERGGWTSVAVLAWEICVVALVGAGIAGRKEAPRLGRDAAAILGLAIVAMGFRLAAVPPRVNADEVSNGIWIRHCAEGRAPELFGTGFVNVPILQFAVDGLLEGWLPGGLLGFRLTTMPVVLLTLVFTYLLARELFGGRFAPAIAAIVTAFHHVFLHYARTGLHYIDSALIATACAYLAVRALATGAWSYGLLAGMVAGVLGQGYFSVRATPVAIVLLLAITLAVPGSRRRADVARVTAAFLLAFIFALGPQLAFYVRDPAALGSREKVALAFSPFALMRADGEAWAKLASNAWLTFLRHTVAPDADAHYGTDRAYLHPLLWPVLLLGAIAIARRPSELPFRLALLWGGVTVGAGAVVLSEPHVRRTLAVIPLYGIAAGAAARWAERSSRARPATAALVLLVGIATVDQIDFVIRRYPRVSTADLAGAVGSFLHAHRDERVQVFTPGALGPDDATVTLLASDANPAWISRTADLRPGPALISAAHAPLRALLAALPGARIAMPWGTAAAWSKDAAAPAEVRNAPPALIVLPEPLAWPPDLACTVTLLDGDDRPLREETSPLPCFDYVPAADPRARSVRITRVVPAGARTITVRSIARSDRRSVRLDGREVPVGVAIPLDGEPHRVEATFVVRPPTDVLWLLLGHDEVFR